MSIRSSDSADGDRNGANRKLVLSALGVVFGDIGTSPLYALRECFNPEHGIAVNEANILGLLSLILWSLVLIISIKYVGDRAARRQPRRRWRARAEHAAFQREHAIGECGRR